MVAGLEEPTRGHDPPRRPGHHAPQAVPAAGQHGLPELRAVPAPGRLRERRVRPAPARRQGRPAAGRRGARPRPARAPRTPQAVPALRRPAAAHRARPGDRQPAARAAARRAARRARPQAAPPDADRAQADPDRGRHHVRARHARPGGGHDDGRHGRRDERRRASSSSARPPDLYEAPRTTFVANFLGQSNLVAARRVEGGRGDVVVVDCYGQKVAVRGDRCVSADDAPHRHPAGEGAPAAGVAPGRAR